LWARVRHTTEQRTWRRSPVYDGRWGGATFEDAPPGGGVLVGFYYTTLPNDWLMDHLQPIYLTPAGEQVGSAYGVPRGPRRCVKAKDGYAVGAVDVRAGDLFDGMAVTFMKAEATGLNPADAYRSPWIGGRGGEPRTVGGDGPFLIGVHGRVVTQGGIVSPGNVAALGVLALPPDGE
jgi:hypothetical protein